MELCSGKLEVIVIIVIIIIIISSSSSSSNSEVIRSRGRGSGRPQNLSLWVTMHLLSPEIYYKYIWITVTVKPK